VFSFAACSNNSGQQAATEATETPATEAPPPAEATAEPEAEEPAVNEVLSEVPRNETLYFGGQQWGAINGWNPYSSTANNAMAIAGTVSRRLIVFETLYMYNLLDGSMIPLLADGQPVWNDARTELTVKINADAKWSDGTPVTADDVAYTYATHLKYETGVGVSNKDFIDTIEAPDASTVVIKAKLGEDGTAVNPYQLEDYINREYVIQKTWTETVEARNSDAEAFKNDPAEDVVFSGPYGPYYDDDQKVLYVRNEDYWGVALWGSLPAPKYIGHVMYADNGAQKAAFTAGDIDVNQQFISDVQNLWLQDGLPISTYIDEAPYGICVTMPSAWYNMKSYGLDQVAVRKAIAFAIDYDAINQNAMTGQSPTFAQAPRSLMNPTAGEQAMYDQAAVADLQWVGNDIEGAIALLDEAGIVDSDGDGWREFDGKKLTYNAVCPNGWSDWQAAMEIVAAAGEKIGIEITTYFPEWDVYQTVFTDGEQTEYDIFMYAGDGTGPTYPWARVRQRFSSEFIGLKNNWTGNYGGYKNDRADEIIAAIPKETDEAKLKELYTEAVKIYLEEVPSFALMYRPEVFHAVNETVWTGYPEEGDGKNIPPTDLTDGYGIAGLYNLKLVN
jgi:peptide/nickel transport system substrate-binding protein